MVNYQNGKIYKIYCDENDDVYYGSTTQELYMRLRQHKSLKYVSRNIMKNTYHIQLIELYPCNNRIELESRERYYIENNKCVNTYIPTRTKQEYRKQHKQQSNERAKKWYNENKEYSSEWRKQYRQKNKDRIDNYKRQVYHYRNSFGGDERYNNNLLRIDISIFQ
jgi:hypothetical protein